MRSLAAAQLLSGFGFKAVYNLQGGIKAWQGSKAVGPQEVLELAMMLEAQALDLYLRFAHQSTNSPTREALFTIADEEKAHLNSPGDLLGEKIQTI